MRKKQQQQNLQKTRTAYKQKTKRKKNLKSLGKPIKIHENMGGQALHILKLDAQMGAKAPIWLDVRTVASAPNESRGLQS